MPAATPPSTPPSPDQGAAVSARRLYREHGPALTAWARRRFPGDEAAVDEVVFDTILAAWRHHDSYDPARGPERAWVFGIARNTAASRHRRQRRHLKAVPAPDPAGAIAEPDDHADRIAESSLVADALRDLSPPHRAVVVAAYWEGLSTREMAARFAIPEGTVKSRLHHALRALRSGLVEREVLR
ncbi:MAG: sigma-70 family RNA polymerase sigma factor [Actinomyces sp.]|nr:MAG: sigma-70 family RNA polymerase sigma factor [Actinomyces sp.]